MDINLSLHFLDASCVGRLCCWVMCARWHLWRSTKDTQVHATFCPYHGSLVKTTLSAFGTLLWGEAQAKVCLLTALYSNTMVKLYESGPFHFVYLYALYLL